MITSLTFDMFGEGISVIRFFPAVVFVGMADRTMERIGKSKSFSCANVGCPKQIAGQNNVFTVGFHNSFDLIFADNVGDQELASGNEVDFTIPWVVNGNRQWKWAFREFGCGIGGFGFQGPLCGYHCCSCWYLRFQIERFADTNVVQTAGFLNASRQVVVFDFLW